MRGNCLRRAGGAVLQHLTLLMVKSLWERLFSPLPHLVVDGQATVLLRLKSYPALDAV